ncbi:MAG: BLUF domain-containing protein [Cyclobacteriaceae bacterium]|nr:BLUF domain-containing protein [Cyclobacteriaceae bacterium]
MLAHLAYVSNRKSTCTESEIESILKSCKKNNPPLNITGVLLYSDTKFIQYVEGESNELLALYDKIKKDPRHDKAVMVSYGPIAAKIFPSWHMANRKLAGAEVDFKTDITASDKEVFHNIMNGQQEQGGRVQELLQKVFKN